MGKVESGLLVIIMAFIFVFYGLQRAGEQYDKWIEDCKSSWQDQVQYRAVEEKAEKMEERFNKANDQVNGLYSMIDNYMYQDFQSYGAFADYLCRRIYDEKYEDAPEKLKDCFEDPQYIMKRHTYYINQYRDQVNNYIQVLD